MTPVPWTGLLANIGLPGFPQLNVPACAFGLLWGAAVLLLLVWIGNRRRRTQPPGES